MIKAVFFDLDGTLLKDDKTVDSSSIQALQQCKNKGIQLFIATARPYGLDKMLGWSNQFFSLFDGGVFCNGACIKIGNQVEYTYIDSEAVHFCVEEIKKYPDYHIALQMKDEAHAMSHSLQEFAIEPWGLQGKTILPISKDCESITAKILIYDHNLVDVENEIPVLLHKTLVNELHENCNIYLTDQNRVLQITSIKATKYTGIKHLQKQCQLKDDEVAVFGDDVNDVEMLAGYKNSIAMGNAKDTIQSIATYVTYSNEEQGISHGLKAILKLI